MPASPSILPRRSSRLAIAIATATIAALALARSGTRAQACDAPFPPIINLPPGFQPEGIAAGRGPVLYVGNFRNGSILAVDARTGEGVMLVPPIAGRRALGLELDARTNHLFVAGGVTGHAFVYDARTGAPLADYALASGATFVNDAVVTRDAVYFTDSARPVLYKLPLGPGGQLPAQDQVVTIALGGDFPFNPRAFNANGIEATPSGDQLIIVNTGAGALYRVDPLTGLAARIDLGGGSVANGDGLLLRGHTLYVVQNFSNQIAVVQLDQAFDRGAIVDVITDPSFDIITTAAITANALYVTNARFSTPPTPETQYAVVRAPIDR